MIRLLIGIGIRLAANAIGLLAAAYFLDDVTLTAGAFVIAVAIFTAVEVLIDPLLTKISLTQLPALRGSVALITTFVGLLVTAAVSSGLQIDGASTWVFATLIVWLATLVATLILPLVFVKKVVNQHST